MRIAIQICGPTVQLLYIIIQVTFLILFIYIYIYIYILSYSNLFIDRTLVMNLSSHSMYLCDTKLHRPI